MNTSEIRQPRSDEYDPYYRSYVERVGTDRLIDALVDQRSKMIDLLEGLSDEDASHSYAAGKWSIKQVLGHILDTERVFAYRALCIARGETQSLPGFDQDEYVASGGFEERSLASLIAEYGATRDSTVALFESLADETWTARGIANGVEITVRALAFIAAGHELHHLAILRERYLNLGQDSAAPSS